MNRRVLACVMLAGLLVTGCSGKGSGGAVTTPTTAPDAGSSSVAKFGTLDNPCHKSDKHAKIKADEAGKGTDKLYIGVPNDRGVTFVPGLLKEMWNTSNAFAEWCNEAGGIAGIPISLVDLDAQFSLVEQAMGTACSSTFALVGGGWAQDDKMFTGKNGSDFAKCHLIDFPSFAVSPEVNEGQGIVQPVPNSAYLKAAAWLVDLAKKFPENTKKLVVAYGIGSAALKANMEQTYAVAAKIPGNPWGAGDPVGYNALQPDMPAAARQVKESGATAVSFVGEAGYLAQLASALKDQNYTGILFSDANMYDPLIIKSASNPSIVEGFLVRAAIHPFEEAESWPAVEQYIKINKDHAKDPDGTLRKSDTPLAVQTFSAWLLFAQSVDKCAADGEITRACVLGAAKGVHEWSGGGLHAVTDPGANKPPPCSMLMRIHDGKFERFYPELDSPEASKDQFSCPDPGLIELPKN